MGFGKTHSSHILEMTLTQAGRLKKKKKGRKEKGRKFRFCRLERNLSHVFLKNTSPAFQGYALDLAFAAFPWHFTSLQSTKLPVYVETPSLPPWTLLNPSQTNYQSPVFRHPSNLTDTVKKSKLLKAEQVSLKNRMKSWTAIFNKGGGREKTKGGEGEEEEKGLLLKMHCWCGNVLLPWKQLICYLVWNAGVSVIQVLILG